MLSVLGQDGGLEWLESSTQAVYQGRKKYNADVAANKTQCVVSNEGLVYHQGQDVIPYCPCGEQGLCANGIEAWTLFSLERRRGTEGKPIVILAIPVS